MRRLLNRQEEDEALLVRRVVMEAGETLRSGERSSALSMRGTGRLTRLPQLEQSKEDCERDAIYCRKLCLLRSARPHALQASCGVSEERME